jgi:hypothetical protein
MKTLLMDKFECAKELGGITPKMVLRYVKENGLPCVYLSRHTIRFDIDAVKRWKETLPKIGKTEKQRKAELRRKTKKEEAKNPEVSV